MPKEPQKTEVQKHVEAVSAAMEQGGIPQQPVQQPEIQRSQLEQAYPAYESYQAYEPVQPEEDAPVQQKKKSPVGLIVAIVLVCLIGAAIGGVFIYGNQLIKRDEIFPNVTVAGVDVSGLKADAAVAAVEDAVNTSYASDTLTVVLPDRELVLDPQVTKVALDPEQAIDAAMAYGRSDGAIRAILAYHKPAAEPYAVNLESSMNLDTEYIRQLIDRTAEEARQEIVEATATVNEAAGTIQIVTGTPGVSLDADGLYAAVLQRFNDSDFSDLIYEYDTQVGGTVELQGYYDKFSREPEDAYYDQEKRELIEEKPGYGFDLPYYTQKIAMAEPGTVITVQMEEIEPEVTLEDLKEVYFSKELARRDTWHTANEGRTENLKLACQAINGMILNPGEEFSFNKVVGERTEEKGYKPAIVYLEAGKSEPETGGGVCQVASTIYEACLYANLEVTERSPHMYEVTYVGPGQDATIYWGSLDFKFKNNTDYPIRIGAWVKDQYVHVNFLGTEDPDKDYDHVVMRGTTTRVDSWKTVGVLEENAKEADEFEISWTGESFVGADGKTYKIAKGTDGTLYKTTGGALISPYTGKSVKVFRDFVDKDENVLRTETIGTSTYIKRNERYLVSLYDPMVDDPNYVDPNEPDPDDPFDPDDPWGDNTDPTDPSDPWGDLWGDGGDPWTDPSLGGDTSGGDTFGGNDSDPWGGFWP